MEWVAILLNKYVFLTGEVALHAIVQLQLNVALLQVQSAKLVEFEVEFEVELDRSSVGRQVQL